MRSGNPFGARPSWGDWLLAIVVGIVSVGGLLWVIALAGVRDDLRNVFEPAALPAVAGHSAEPPVPDVGGDPVADVPTPAALPAGAAVVYSCMRGGGRVYSDQPCGADGEIRVIDPAQMNRYTPSAVDTAPIAAVPRVTPAERSSASGPQDDANASVCRALEDAIERLNSRMRAGYGSAEGEGLRRRWRDLKAAHHEAGCTWHEPGS